MLFYENNIKVTLKISNLRIVKNIFDTNDTDIQRGQIGFGVNGISF